MTGFCCFLKSCRPPPRFRAGIPQNTVRDAYCYLYDLYPTLCGLAGIGVPATVKGISLEETRKAGLEAGGAGESLTPASRGKSENGEPGQKAPRFRFESGYILVSLGPERQFSVGRLRRTGCIRFDIRPALYDLYFSQTYESRCQKSHQLHLQTPNRTTTYSTDCAA